MSQDTTWKNRFEAVGAFWHHDNNPKRPHVLLTSDGNHSGECFNGERVMEDAFLLDEACIELLMLLRKAGLDPAEVDRVVGPAMGAIRMAHEIAYHIATHNMRPCLSAYTEKDTDEDGRKRMVFKRTVIRPGERVLVCEDTTTTGKSIALTAKAIEDAGGIVLPLIPVLVNRSTLTEVYCRQIVSLISQPMTVYLEHDKCPYCQMGSEPVRPKSIANWARLTAKY